LNCVSYCCGKYCSISTIRVKARETEFKIVVAKCSRNIVKGIEY
jgi:hypothetical protein